MRHLGILAVIVLLTFPARAQNVYEAALLLDGGGNAVLWSGKFWLRVDRQGNAQFQTVVASFPASRAVIAARIEVPGAVVDFAPGKGSAGAYQGCNLPGPNPFLSLPSDPGEVICDAFITGTFYEGNFKVEAEMAAGLAAQQGVVHLRLDSPDVTGPFGGGEITGTLQITGAALNRQYFLVSPDSTRLAPSGDSLRLVWAAQPGGQYLIQVKSDLAQAAWQNNGPAFAATNSVETVDIPLINSARTAFYRILSLR